MYQENQYNKHSPKNNLQFKTIDSRFGLQIVDQKGFNTFRDSMFSESSEARQGLKGPIH